jgi:hypothetical protein
MMSSSELITWVPASILPKADVSVLAWVVYDDQMGDEARSDWHALWHDGEAWHDCTDGGPVFGLVSHWATVKGPA